MRVKLLVAGALAGLLATGGTATAKRATGRRRPAAAGSRRRRRSPRPGSPAAPSRGSSAPRRRSRRRPGRMRRCRSHRAVAAARRSARARPARRRRPSRRGGGHGLRRERARGGSGARGRTSSGSPTPRTGARSTATTSRTARRASTATGTLCSTNWTGSALISGGIGYSWFVDALVGRVRVPDRDPVDHAAPEPLPRRLAQRVGQLGDRRSGLGGAAGRRHQQEAARARRGRARRSSWSR